MNRKKASVNLFVSACESAHCNITNTTQYLSLRSFILYMNFLCLFLKQTFDWLVLLGFMSKGYHKTIFAMCHEYQTYFSLF